MGNQCMCEHDESEHDQDQVLFAPCKVEECTCEDFEESDWDEEYDDEEDEVEDAD